MTMHYGLKKTIVFLPLAMAREGILDKYFFDITVQPVESESDGWDMIKDYPSLWNKN